MGRWGSNSELLKVKSPAEPALLNFSRITISLDEVKFRQINNHAEIASIHLHSYVRTFLLFFEFFPTSTCSLPTISLSPSRNKKRQQKEVSQFKFIKKSNIHLPILFAIILSYLIFPSSNLLFYVFLSLRLSSLSLLIYSLTSVLGISLFSIYILLLLHQLFLPFRLPVSQIIHSGGKFSFPIFIIRDVFLVCVVVYLSVFVLIMIYKLCVLGVLGSFHFFK